MTDDAPGKKNDIQELLEILRYQQEADRLRLLALTLADYARYTRTSKPPSQE